MSWLADPSSSPEPSHKTGDIHVQRKDLTKKNVSRRSSEVLPVIKRCITNENDRICCLKFSQSLVLEKALNLPTRYARVTERFDFSLFNRFRLPVPAFFDTATICDPNIPGFPLKYYTSDFDIGPRGLVVGGCKFLNSPDALEERSVLTVSGRGEGDLQFFLEVMAPVLDPSQGRKSYFLVCRINVTDITQHVALAETHDSAPLSWSNRVMDSLKAAPTYPQYMHETFDFLSHFPLLTREYICVLHDVAEVHKRFLALVPPGPGLNTTEAAQKRYYITYVSQTLLASRNDIRINFKMNPLADLKELSRKLGRGRVFEQVVFWGYNNDPVLLHCVPMEDGKHEKTVTRWWLCFMLDIEVGRRLYDTWGGR